MKAYTYLPFFYFQHTRLNNLKALFFHGVYEWIPAFILSLYSSPAYGTVVGLLLYYLAFISVYEMGYLLNDQLAHEEENGRKRTDKLPKGRIVLFVVIRLMVFLSITFFQGHMSTPLWWAWYSILVLQFALHNFVKPPSLNVLTFSTLAFIRFFSPIIVLVPPSLITTLVLPVFLNYVLFRLFIYMDSKEMLKGFDRQTNRYRIGYYLVLFGFSALIGFVFDSWIPLAFNLYFFFAALIFTISPLYKGKLSI